MGGFATTWQSFALRKTLPLNMALFRTVELSVFGASKKRVEVLVHKQERLLRPGRPFVLRWHRYLCVRDQLSLLLIGEKLRPSGSSPGLRGDCGLVCLQRNGAVIVVDSLYTSNVVAASVTKD